MRSLSFGAVCALSVLALVASADSAPSSNGDFQFTLTGASGSVQYNARGTGGDARGELSFSGVAEISGEDVDGEDTTPIPVSEFTMTVSFDCLRVQNNRAAMSGVVSSASVPALIGTRAVLAVEDNGEGAGAARDRFTWGIYRAASNSWTPVDAEDPSDIGATLTWFASDAEEPSDTPVLWNYNKGNAAVDCSTFPFGSYALEELPLGAGNIQVRP